ncbi:MAG TPA: hypothetical protein VHS27_13285, partial [Gaiellales bacterium]|nr:hypothetical protein [Gaiellales bacterium]
RRPYRTRGSPPTRQTRLTTVTARNHDGKRRHHDVAADACGHHGTPAPPAGATADGRVLNDQGYALVQRGEYDAAIPPLRQAVADLRGAGPADPYEAYANSNLGYALLQVGDCADALPPLEAANRLQTSPLVDAAIRRAESCARQGS